MLTMAGDGQHSLRGISKLLEHTGVFDMVVGSRQSPAGQEWIRKPDKLRLSWTATYPSNMKIPDINSGFRLIRKRCVEEFIHILPNGFSFSTTITMAMIKAGYHVTFIPVQVAKRKTGSSRVKQTRDGFAAILLIIRCISLFNPLKIYAPGVW